MGVSQQSIRNRFLCALKAEDFALLAAHLKQVDLPRRTILVEENKLIEHVYYLDSGLASIAALEPTREMIEVGVFGFEGTSNFVLNPGQDKVPLRTFMQIPGMGWRIEAQPYAEAVHASSSLMSAVMRYEQYKACQFAYTALSHGSYTLLERLARWILMGQDRVGDTFDITHEYLAMMLAVRRAGVTEGVQKLEGMRLIRAMRGSIKVLDRSGLCAIANGSYGVPEKEYERLIGPLVPAGERQLAAGPWRQAG